MRKFLSLILLSIITVTSLAASTANILNLRFSDSAIKVRLVLDVTSAVAYHVSQTSNPQRITLDLENAVLTKPIDKTSFKNLPLTLVSSEANKDQDWRLVLAANNPLVAKTFLLPPNEKNPDYRLVLDLYKTQPIVLEKPAKITPKEKITHDPSPAQLLATELNKSVPQPPSIQTKDQGARPIMIVIDPGHGGKDPGAIGVAGSKEKAIVLAISKRLQDMINKEPGFKAVLTRNTDTFISLRQRLDIARKYKADMFIAIHADAFKNRSSVGASVFALSERGATSEAARWLAEKENQSEMIGVGDLSEKDQLLRSVLIDLSQTHTIAMSLQIGSSVLRSLSKVTHLHHKRVEQAAFVVLKSPDIPSLLIETGYISNPRQEQQLMSASYQQQIAKAVLQGVKNYFQSHPQQGTLLT